MELSQLYNYKATRKTIADSLTKPMRGVAFEKIVNLIELLRHGELAVNWSGGSVANVCENMLVFISFDQFNFGDFCINNFFYISCQLFYVV